jgi:DNA-binding transcriptional ArsR family regulator
MGVVSPAAGARADTGSDEADAAASTPVSDSTSGAAGLYHPARESLELPAVMHALSDPVRLKIVATLAECGECSCRSIDLPVVKSTCTHHFRVLREAGVIRQRLESTAKLNSLRREDLDARWPGLLDAVLVGLGA